MNQGLTRHARAAGALVAAALFCCAAPLVPAHAQAIAAIVNGDVITTTEVAEEMKYLRAVREPADRNAAIEALIGDRLRLRETLKYGVDANEQGLNQTLSRIAKRLNTTSDAFAALLQRAKVNPDTIRSHLRAVTAWNIYVRNRNKALSVSEEDITAALAKDSQRARADADFQLQQIVFVVPVGATPAQIEQRTREAQALRSRFSDCASGLPLARALPDVAIKPPITRNSSTLSPATRAELDQIPKGHLTGPSRSSTGIEVIAVCGKADQADQTTLRENVQNDLVTERLSKVADEMYATLRASAVVEKR